jgi:hypothetical protein
MTLQQFKALSQDRQYKDLLLSGVCLASREMEAYSILLFQLNNCYVEIYFDKYCDDISHSRSFQDTDKLYPYLEQMDINTLVES